VAQITKVLRRTADAEAIAIPDEACALIARSATGSFRDALGTLEQLLAYSGASIELADVLAVLGAADADLLFGAIDAIAAGDARSALLAAARLADSGRDIGRFFGDLEAHARSLMIVQTLGGEVPPELQVTAEQDERLREQAARVSPTDVVRVLDLIAVGLRAMKDGSDARTQLELALVKAALPKVDASAKALQSRLERLEAGRPAAAPARGPSFGRSPEVPATAAGRAAPKEVLPAAPDAAPPAAPSNGAPKEAPAAPAAPAEEPASEGAAPAASSPAAPEAAPPAGPSAPTREPSVAAVAVVDPPGQEPVVAAMGLDLDAFADLWPAVIESIQAERPLLAEHLKVARPSALGDGELTLAWAETAGLSKRKAEDAANRELIVRAIRAVTGAGLKLAHELAPDTPEETTPTLSHDELVERFVEEFEAEILEDPEETS
jgi:DNA polymerase-3 subunit gamma/tau